MSKYSTDIFAVLAALDKKDLSYFESLNEKEMKDLSPFVLMRWLYGTNDAAQVYLLNEVVNTKVFALQKNKELLMGLLSVCTNGKPKRYKWSKGKGSTKYINCVSVIKEYFKYNLKEAKDAFNILKDADILSYAEQLGKQDDDLAKIRKELKQRKND